MIGLLSLCNFSLILSLFIVTKTFSLSHSVWAMRSKRQPRWNQKLAFILPVSYPWLTMGVDTWRFATSCRSTCWFTATSALQRQAHCTRPYTEAKNTDYPLFFIVYVAFRDKVLLWYNTWKIKHGIKFIELISDWWRNSDALQARTEGPTGPRRPPCCSHSHNRCWWNTCHSSRQS